MATTESPAKENIEYYSGAAINKSYTITDSDGAAVDLSGKSLKFTIKKRKKGCVIAELDSAIIVSGTGDNIVTLPLNFELDEMIYYYDLWNVTDDYPLMYGRFETTEKVIDD